jgi:hypothetical protein
MRTKERRLIVAFRTTHDAMAFEDYCKKNDISGRLIPLPGEISAGCGLSWSASPDDSGAVKDALDASGVKPQEMRVLFV